jgi:hypothetical protein
MNKTISRIIILVFILIAVIVAGNLGFQYINSSMVVLNQKAGVLQVVDDSTSYLQLKNQLAHFHAIRVILIFLYSSICIFIAINIGILIARIVNHFKEGR